MGQDAQQAEYDEDAQERLDTGIAETQRRATLAVDVDWVTDLCKGVLADRTVAARSLHLQEAPVGSKADLPQRREMMEPLAHAKAVTFVTMDCHAPYRCIVRLAFPNARIVADAFHLHRQANHALAEVRRAAWRLAG